MPTKRAGIRRRGVSDFGGAFRQEGEGTNSQLSRRSHDHLRSTFFHHPGIHYPGIHYPGINHPGSTHVAGAYGWDRGVGQPPPARGPVRYRGLLKLVGDPAMVAMFDDLGAG
jgi:hypothetical protein